MGTYYFIVSHKSTREIVEKEDFEKIDEYIKNPKEFRPPVAPLFGKPVIPEKYIEFAKQKDGAFQIASRAVELGKENVLRHIQDKIDFSYSPDGNAYNLFDLATEEGQFHLIDVLYDISYNHGYRDIAKDQLSYSMRRLLGYCELSEEKVIEHLPVYIKKDVNLSDVFYYSKYWEKPKVYDWLIGYCSEKYIGWSFNDIQKARESGKLTKEKERSLVNQICQAVEDIYTVDSYCAHELVLSDYSKGDYIFGWNCNKCNIKGDKNTKRWFCIICSNDLCKKCY